MFPAGQVTVPAAGSIVFWQLHSTSPAEEVARATRAVVWSDPRLDTAWLPKGLLRELDGEHLWVKSAFEADEL